MRKLPHWVLTDSLPAFYDSESLTAIQQTARLYGAMQELIDEYNKFVTEINEHIEKWEAGLYAEFEDFKAEIKAITDRYQELLNIFDGLQQQIDQLVIEGDSSVEAAQARVSTDSDSISISYTTLKERLDTEHNQLIKQLAKTNDDLHLRCINVMCPPTPLVGAKADGTDDSEAVKNIIKYIKETDKDLILYFPEGQYTFESKIGTIDFPLRMCGAYACENGTSNNAQTGTILIDNTSTENDDGTPFIKYSADDNDSTVYGSFLNGTFIRDLYIKGNYQNHDGLYIKKVGWGLNVQNVCIAQFGGSGLYEDEVYDATFIGLTISKCGGASIDGEIRYSLHLNALLGDYTNGQHFYGTHIEHTRYALKLDKVRGVMFDSIKVEISGYDQVDDFTNPFIWVTEKALSVDMRAIHLVGKSVSDILANTTLTDKTVDDIPYMFQKDRSSASNLYGQTMTIGTIHTLLGTPSEGAKWLKLNGATINNAILGNSTGATYSSFFTNCNINNLDFTTVCHTDGSSYGIDIYSYCLVGNLKGISYNVYNNQQAHPGVYLHGYYSRLESYDVRGFSQIIKTSAPASNGVQLRRSTLEKVVNGTTSILDFGTLDSNYLILNPSADMTITNFQNVTVGEIVTLYNNTGYTIAYSDSGSFIHSGNIQTGYATQFIVGTNGILAL